MKLKTNKYGVYEIHYYSTLKRHGVVESLGTKDLKDATKKYEHRKAELTLGIKVEKTVSGCPFYKDAFEDFKNDLINRESKKNTIEAHINAYRHLIKHHGNRPLDQYGIINVRMDINDGKHSWNTFANYAAHLHMQFAFFMKRPSYYKITENPISEIRPKKREPEAIPKEYLQAYFDALKECPIKYYCAKLAYLGAYRREELIHVTAEQFNFENGTFKVVNLKGKRIDTLPMLSDLEDFLRTEYFVQGTFFPYYAGHQIYDFWYQAGKRLVKEGKIPKIYQFHQLRKTRATELYNLGMGNVDVQSFLRHKHFYITDSFYIEKEADKATKEAQSARERMNKILNPVELKVYQIGG